MDTDLPAILLDALEGAAEVIVRGIDGLAQQPLQPVPRGQDLPQWAFADHPSLAIDGDALRYLDAEIARAGAAALQRLQQFGVGGDAGAAADELHGRALEHVDVPADAAQEGRREQARHRAADDDGATAAALRRCHWDDLEPGRSEIITAALRRGQRSRDALMPWITAATRRTGAG